MTRTPQHLMAGVVLLTGLAWSPQWPAAGRPFHDVPAAEAQRTSPLRGVRADIDQGLKLYAMHCETCHGSDGRGTGNIPAVVAPALKDVSEGALFWFIGRGSPGNGMPPWDALSEQQRWQLVALLKHGAIDSHAPVALATGAATALDAPAARPPFLDFRDESPGARHHLSVGDLPAPYASSSASNAPKVVARPPAAWPVVPAGFRVGQYAQGLDRPRVLRVAPNGDIFVAESGAGRIRVLRGLTPDNTAQSTSTFAEHLERPYGVAFYPPGPDPAWVYVGDTDAVLRFPYRNGDLKARGGAERLIELPHGGGHWTRDLQFSADGKTLFVAVGSASNVDDPDTTAAEHDRANILAFDPDGSHKRIHASGIRNPSGLALDPLNSQLWCTVNERDGLGDNLVPDYITAVQPGGFYGWPWWYTGAHQDPRHAGKHPELRDRVIVPDVLLQPHNASLQILFYEGRRFPEAYRGDLFAAEHGSWNKSVRTGYEVIRVPRHHGTAVSGEYEDFLTGFVLPNGDVWGRPVGLATAPDGALLVSDDAANVIWRVDYPGP